MSRSGRLRDYLGIKGQSTLRLKELNREQANNKFQKSIINLNKKGNNIIKKLKYLRTDYLRKALTKMKKDNILLMRGNQEVKSKS